MKKILPLLIIILSSILIPREVLSLPNSSGVLSFFLKNNYFGTDTMPDKSQYVGEFQNNKFNGQGASTSLSPDGTIRESIWKDGECISGDY